ncbi:MAG: translation initiation factor IF-2 [Candidatus Shapirobacteria bacterium]
MNETRPPVVAILGHVDHGKTTLLDKIRKTNLAKRESGGITQHIGAYQIEFASGKGKSQKVTFIDTPGHAAFAKMRSRGAQATDLAILVVAADEGVKEQTRESFSHIKAAKIPYLVAITKIDLPKAEAQKIKEQLLDMDIELAEAGGEVPAVSVSGLTGEGVSQLLKEIISLAEKASLEADKEADFQGIVIESSKDSRRGALNTVLVKSGTLRVKDELIVNGSSVTVRALFNDLGRPVDLAVPSDPVVVLGLSEPLEAGSIIGKEINIKKEKKKEEEREKDIFAKKEKKLTLLIKADAQGTLEAILNNLPSDVQIVHSGIGEVTDSDVFLAQASGLEIIAFRVKVHSSAKRLAADNGVLVKEFALIYELLEDVDRSVLRLLSPDIEKEIAGQAEIVAEFEIDKKRVAGCRVTQGEINRQQTVAIKRSETVLKEEVKISSMKHLKEDISLAKKGQEFGVTFSPLVDFKIGDVIISYK